MTESKIMRGLREALVSVRCEHAFSPWSSRPMAGCEKMRAWSRTCPHCGIRETVFSEQEPPR